LIHEFAVAAACFFATVLAMTALRPVAVVIDLVDKPGGRKTHRGDIPVVGGVAMFMGCVFGIGLLPPNDFIGGAMLSAAALVVLVGMLDDRFEISPVARLAAHIVAAFLMLATSGTFSIVTLGSPFGDAPVMLSGLASMGFTCLAIVGAINAFNMLDGMDGLAGTMAFIALTALAFLSSSIGGGVVSQVSMVCCCAVAAFLIFNIPARFNRRFRCFMGDAGSTLLGFVLACLCIGVSQGEGPRISPTTTLWIVALPLYELLWATMRRLLQGRSPLYPDRAHFHHKLLDAGFGVRGSFFVLICIGSLLAAAGLIIHEAGVSDQVSFFSWLSAGAAMVVLMHNAQVLWRFLPKGQRRPRPMEFEGA
jgi:UDP-GlcNAc:undecaprenyl-phosphate/decaprenyl-phosphate GlcNAc-1-phosphate transferase